MVKLTREEIEAFLEDDGPIRERLRLESILSFGWVFVACFAYSILFVVVFVTTSQIYGVDFYVETSNLPPKFAEAIPATEAILKVRVFITMMLSILTCLAFVFRRGFLTMLIISAVHSLNALIQSWAFFNGLGPEHVTTASIAIELAGVLLLPILLIGGGIYWSRYRRDIFLDF